MSIQSCIVDKSRIARLIEYLFESYSCIAGNISLKFEIRSCADVYECIEHAYMGRYRCGYDRNGAYLWKGFPFTMRQKVVIAPNKWTGPNCPRHHDGGHQYFISVRLRLRRLMLLLGWSGSARSIFMCREKIRTALSNHAMRCCIFVWRRVKWMR